jgi:hypothetical protein
MLGPGFYPQNCQKRGRERERESEREGGEREREREREMHSPIVSSRI